MYSAYAQGYTLVIYIIYIYILLSSSYFVCPLFHFRMSQNIVVFLNIKVINLLILLLYPY